MYRLFFYRELGKEKKVEKIENVMKGYRLSP